MLPCTASASCLCDLPLRPASASIVAASAAHPASGPMSPEPCPRGFGCLDLFCFLFLGTHMRPTSHEHRSVHVPTNANFRAFVSPSAHPPALPVRSAVQGASRQRRLPTPLHLTAATSPQSETNGGSVLWMTHRQTTLSSASSRASGLCSRARQAWARWRRGAVTRSDGGRTGGAPRSMPSSAPLILACFVWPWLDSAGI